jgi:hypothetical protein
MSCIVYGATRAGHVRSGEEGSVRGAYPYRTSGSRSAWALQGKARCDSAQGNSGARQYINPLKEPLQGSQVTYEKEGLPD